ncbi:MAG: DUF4157 domain-containing protein, partial [Spirulina sp. SIO3F2]|nr:DUF4157 domain-containing protein [Spirulina sp. SIO3F2]
MAKYRARTPKTKSRVAKKSQSQPKVPVYSRPFPSPSVQRDVEQPQTANQASNYNAFASLATAEETTSAATEMSIMPKLTVGAAGDKYEQEADAVAAQVVRQLNSPAPPPVQREEEEKGNLLQMRLARSPLQLMTGYATAQTDANPLQTQPCLPQIQCVDGYEDEDEKLQRKPLVQLKGASAGGTASPDLEKSIQREQGKGQPLADSVRQPMENAFGANFGGVRIHTDNTADQLNRSIQAQA